MKHLLFVAALAFAAALLTGVSEARAQSGVGNLRIVDESGVEMGREQAPPGEKHFRLPVGTTVLRVAFDYEGSTATPVQVRVMGPSGTVIHQSSEEYDTTGTHTVEFDNDGQPFAEQEYVVNSYIGTDPYLADSLQLVIGEAEILSSEEIQPASSATDEDEGVMILDPAAAAPDTSGPSVPGGPSMLVLGLAALGIIALSVVVIWAAISARKHG